MKKILLPLILLSFFCRVQAQRYLTEVFDQVQMTPDIFYGQALSAEDTIANLAMDIFEPVGDTEELRPLMVLVHGGSFVGGDRRDPLMMAVCETFAKKGYVTVTMSYRLGIDYGNFLNLGDELSRATLRAVQDHNAAMRFFYKSARDEGNPYRIDTTRIISGGVSAGAIASLHSQLFIDPVTAPEKIQQFLEELGGLDGGNDGSPGYPKKGAGIFNMMGAILDTDLINVSDVPAISFHGDADVVVPYGEGFATFNGIIVIQVDGSSLVHETLVSQGTPSELHTFPGIGHELVLDAVRMDTIMERASRFFYDQVINKSATVSTRSAKTFRPLSLYPNPADAGVIYLNILENQPYLIFDMSGRQIKSGILTEGQNEVRVSDIKSGMYILRTPDAVGRFVIP